MKQIILISIALVSVFLAGCSKDRIVGNGNVITENRSVSSFSRVISRGDIVVTVVPDSITGVTVKAESNIIPYVNTTVNGNTVIIDFDNDVNIREHSDVRVTLHTANAEYLELQGSGSIASGDFGDEAAELYLSGSGTIEASYHTNSLKASISGSGNIALNGSAYQTTLHISGSGNIRALNLVQNTCNASISGSGNIYVNVLQKIVADISGSGCVYYTGNPSIESSISGSGNVSRY